MAGRIRSIKPDVLEDSETSCLSDGAFRLFVGLLLQADDYGNLRVHPGQLCGTVFWGAPRAADEVEELLAELAGAGVVRLYTVPREDSRDPREDSRLTCAHIVGWKVAGHPRAQKVDHPGQPKVPGPDDEKAEAFQPLAESSREPRESSREPRERSRLTGSGSEGKGREREGRPAPPVETDTGSSLLADPDLVPRRPNGRPALDFETAYQRYPNKKGKLDGLATCRREIRTPADYDDLVRAIDEYARQVVGKDPQYVLHFDTFMRKERWREYLPSEATPTRPNAERGVESLTAEDVDRWLNESGL